eukprot:CAMPEP_0198469610 /NCGR_PEP_ID=MMETSP1456-20131121/14022_1 /TAXON_ID=1461544 ORGANISM="Unidentified sp., Strain RCC1871" /NCGR_SAMPLE_ID=MMETSP1456 /ASSEMBLY_ACC=CAM_ASM_001119 /LENGTH=95 /DNA_ID=CAMNT_0044196033 /DNA_START=14 /DNA_END=300 /DNA_ORIENTATION=+
MGSRREGTQAEKRKRGCDREVDDVAGECGDLDNLTRKVQRLRASLEQAGEADLDGGGARGGEPQGVPQDKCRASGAALLQAEAQGWQAVTVVGRV